MQTVTVTSRVLCPFVLYFLVTVSGSEDGCPSFTPDQVVACPGDEAAFNCTVVDAAGSQTTIWSGNATIWPTPCSVTHPLGLNDVTNCAPNITTQLLEVNGTCYTSTLQLTVTEDLHGVLVQCSHPTSQDVIGNGLILLLEDTPLPPSTVQYTVLQYKKEYVDIVVTWQYNGPRVDRFTLSVTNATDEVLTDISEDTTTKLSLPYNQNLTLSVTASNCVGTSAEDSIVYYQAGCELPPNPTNGLVDDFERSEEGAELVYECNPGLIPTGQSISTCTAGEWVPDPATLQCSCPGSEDAFFPEYKSACPGDLVTFSCTVIDDMASQTTIWTANTTDDRCAVIHALSGMRTDTCGPFTSELGTKDEDNGCFPSTLSVVVTPDLDTTLIECFSPLFQEQSKIGSGLLVIEKDAPLPIGDLEYNITSYGRQAVGIQIQWTYPAIGPQVDEYTVTATADNLDSPIILTDDRTSFTLTNLYYNTNYTISVTASNCNGFNNGSTLEVFERGCDVPQPPMNGTIIGFDSAQVGATITYRCDRAVITAFGLQALLVVAECTNEGWVPNPAEVNCTAATLEGKSGANIYIVGGSIIGGSILLLAAEAVMLAVCCAKMWKEAGNVL